MVAFSIIATNGGCRSSSAGQALAPNLAGNDAQAQMDFWHTLPQRRVASNDEAFHGLLLYIDGEDPAADFAGRVKSLQERRMLPHDFSGTAEGSVKRGTVAVILARALEIKGGLTMRVFGPSPRYATRELQYVGLFPQSSPQQTFSGPELLGIIGRAEDYQRLYNENALADEKDAGDPKAPPRGPAVGAAETASASE